MNLIVKYISPLKVEIWVAPMTLEGLRDHHVGAIQSWVELAELGYRTAYNQWRLVDESAMSAFVLYWHGKQVDE